HMNMLTKRQNLTWSIQNDQLQILTPDRATFETTVLLASDTGLINIPSRKKVINLNALKVKDGEKTESGITCTALLNGEIKVGRLITIKSNDLDGLFRVEKVKYVGDTHGQPWYCEVEAKE